MPETTPLIKAALNLRGGAGFDVYKNNVIKVIIEINILKYPTQNCVIKWLKEKLIFELIF